MKRLSLRKDKIINWMSDKDQSPLYFGTELITPIGETLEGLVLDTLDKARIYGSLSQKGMYETSAGRLRSAFDIWRHIKAVKGDVDIFQVMETMYAIKDQLYGHYCYMVKRSVFNLNHYYHGRVGDPASFNCTELGIKFSTWRKLHE